MRMKSVVRRKKEKKMNISNNDAIRKKVRERYASIALAEGDRCGCLNTCCSTQAPTSKEQSAKLGYSSSELDSVPEGAHMGLGCGNPQAVAMC